VLYGTGIGVFVALVQAAVNHKYLGYFIVVVVYIGVIPFGLPAIGLEHPLLRFGRLTHQDTVAVSKDEKQPKLCCGNAALFRSRGNPPLQAAMRHIEKEDEATVCAEIHEVHKS